VNVHDCARAESTALKKLQKAIATNGKFFIFMTYPAKTYGTRVSFSTAKLRKILSETGS